MAADWQDVRARAGLDEDNVAAHRERMTAEVRASREHDDLDPARFAVRMYHRPWRLHPEDR